MAQVELILPDGKVLAAEPGTPYRDVVRGIGEGLLRNALAVTVAGVNHTLERPGRRAAGRFTVITRGTRGRATRPCATRPRTCWPGPCRTCSRA